jgi:hypothetical protein
MDTHTEDMFIDTDIFVMMDTEEVFYDFVSIDESMPEIPVFIDISNDEMSDIVTIDFDNSNFDAFVNIDEDQIFISGFK